MRTKSHKSVDPILEHGGHVHLVPGGHRRRLDLAGVGGVVTFLISAYYILRVIVMMYMRPGEPETRSEGLLNATVWLTALGLFVFGILPGPLLTLATQTGFLLPLSVAELFGSMEC